MKQSAEKEKMADFASILFDQAVLAEGALPDDPAGFVRKVNALLAKKTTGDSPLAV